MKSTKKNISATKKGFTLIEVITVLFIVSLGMVGVLTLIVQNIQSQNINKGTLIAYQLAQEGVELVREVRDTNWHLGYDWRTGLASGDYYMDYNDIAPHAAPSRSYGNLKQDASGMYQSNPFPATPGTIFYRIITIANHDPGIMVTANIYWTDHGHNYTYSLDALLYDWR